LPGTIHCPGNGGITNTAARRARFTDLAKAGNLHEAEESKREVPYRIGGTGLMGLRDAMNLDRKGMNSIPSSCFI
jgi:hypothetical protein